jgi:OOP family OmpA-OmpF porin
MIKHNIHGLAIAGVMLGGPAAFAQPTPNPAIPNQANPAQSQPSSQSSSVQAFATPALPAAGKPAAANGNPEELVMYFDLGSASVRAADAEILDHAARLYRDGKPLVMVVSGSTDTTGSAEANLRLSEARAAAVLQGLVARGIPAERFELLAKGATDPAVPTPPNTAEPRDRRVEITWR